MAGAVRACYTGTHCNEMYDAVHWLQSAWALSFRNANPWTKHISGRAMWQGTGQNWKIEAITWALFWLLYWLMADPMQSDIGTETC